MKSVMKSVSPRICEKVASGDCTILVSKTAPQEVPFKCYIYETKGKKIECGFHIEDTGITLREKHVFGMHKARIVKHYRNEGRGKVIGEFICDNAEWMSMRDCDKACMTLKEAIDYGKGKKLYAWHISDLKIYGKPKELGEFKTPPCEKNEKACGNCKWLVKRNTPDVYECECYVEDGRPITRAPQSYMYVEELDK